MTKNINFKEKYFRIVAALGYDPESIDDYDFEDLEQVAKILSKVRMSMLTSNPEKTGQLFVCGQSGAVDDQGLPDYLHICPTYGLDKFVIYTKTNSDPIGEIDK